MATLDSLEQAIVDLKENTNRRFDKVDSCIDKLFAEEKAHARLVPLHEKQLRDLENGQKKTVPFIDGAKAVLAVVAVLCSFAGAFVFFLIKTIFEKL